MFGPARARLHGSVRGEGAPMPDADATAEQFVERLARSTSPWERRTAILATLWFVRRGDLDDTFRIAEALARDDHDLVQKAVGGALREAGKHDRGRLRSFLDDHAATMPRTALRYAIEHLDKDERADYLA